MYCTLAVFMLQRQKWVIATDTAWPTKPKIYTLALFRESLPCPA